MIVVGLRLGREAQERQEQPLVSHAAALRSNSRARAWSGFSKSHPRSYGITKISPYALVRHSVQARLREVGLSHRARKIHSERNTVSLQGSGTASLR